MMETWFKGAGYLLRGYYNRQKSRAGCKGISRYINQGGGQEHACKIFIGYYNTSNETLETLRK